MQIKIKDFNCIENIELEFKPGFTILQGPSNSGKSSIIKAVENCIFNQSGTTNVRQGCKNYSIGIKKDDHTVSLIKGKDTKYKVDDVVYEKIGVSQLAEVAEALNIRETVLGGEKVRLNFSKQMSYPFLLDKTPGQLYKFIVDSSESESLSNVLKDISKDIKDLDKSLTQNEAQIDILSKQQIQLNENLKNADAILEISNKIIDMDIEYQRVEQLTKYKQSHISLSSEIKRLQAQIASYNINIDISNLECVMNDYSSYMSVYNDYKKAKSEYDVLLDKIQDYNAKVDLSKLSDLYEKHNSVKSLISQYNILNSSISSIRDQILEYDSEIGIEKNKLSKFKICPLCGKELE